MQPIGRAVRFGVAAVALLVGGTEILAGQGVTSAAVQGRVTSETRGNVQSAIVVVTNTSTGAKQQTTPMPREIQPRNATPGGPTPSRYARSGSSRPKPGSCSPRAEIRPGLRDEAEG